MERIQVMVNFREIPDDQKDSICDRCKKDLAKALVTMVHADMNKKKEIFLLCDECADGLSDLSLKDN